MRYLDHCKYTEQRDEHGEHTYTFSGPCVVTGKPYSVTVKGHDLYRYRQGALIQDAFPSLSADDREFLMTGMSPEGWNQAMRQEPEE